jgi:hypothetical protein
MSWRKLLIIALAGVEGCVHSASTWAQTFRSVDQMPGMTDQDATKVVIANIGTVALSILYLDPDGAWKTVPIPSGQYVILPSQDTGLSVSFNDGVDAKSVTLNRGATYGLHWDSPTSRWAIAPYDEVAKRASGFRSR